MRNPSRWAMVLIGALVLWHAVVGSLLGLGDAETLYYYYSRHLD